MSHKINIDNESYDPYYILGVTQHDPIETVETYFKYKAKILHPDKSKLKDKSLAEKNFRILKESYDYIINNLTSSSSSPFDINRHKNSYKNNKNPNLHDPSITMDNFNKKFEETRPKLPQDFGYTTNRLQNVEEYDNFNYKPTNIFGNKKFNPDDFNKMFEYHSKKNGAADNNNSLIHKTTDGFWGSNSPCLSDNVASVNSYNGLLITGDDYGQSGVGYYGNTFSDFKQSFSSVSNPNETIEEFNKRINSGAQERCDDTPLTQDLFKKRLNEHINERDNMLNSIKNNWTGSKVSFRQANEEFERKKLQDLKNDINKSKQFITNYSETIFKKHLIEDALNNKLEMSADTFGSEFNEKLSIQENMDRKDKRQFLGSRTQNSLED